MSWGVATQNGVSVSLASIVSLSCGATEFSPASLFTSGVQGAWYDPSDYSTLFQDSAGTTPVTAVEQPVGLMLDKSQGATPGPELVPDSSFDTPASWTPETADWVVSSGKATYTKPGAGVQYLQSNDNISIASGTWYKVTFTLSGMASGTAIFGLFNKTASTNYLGAYQTVSANGTYSIFFLATSSTTGIRIYGNSGGTATSWSFDSFSIKSFAGNHASQATTASRPVLRARYNLLTYSEQFDNAAWTKGGGSTVTANSVTAPDGTTTADTLVLTTGSATSQLYQSVAVTNGPVTVSVWLRADAPVTLDFGFYDSASDVGSINVTTEWQRFTRTRAGGLTGADRRACWLYKGSAGGTTVYIWGAMLNTGSSAGTYQRIAAATDYATAGFLPYLALDGTDDSFGTGSIDFSGTDKMFVCAGLTKNSDAARGIVVELSTTAGNVGTFSSSAPLSAGLGNYDFASGGSIPFQQAVSPSSYSAPITNVLTGLGDISADRATLRINGSQVAQATTDQGTGNYGNYPLYIGRRGGSTLPLNGRIYQMVVCGKTLSASELASTESFVATKTGVTL